MITKFVKFVYVCSSELRRLKTAYITYKTKFEIAFIGFQIKKKFERCGGEEETTDCRLLMGAILHAKSPMRLDASKELL